MVAKYRCINCLEEVFVTEDFRIHVSSYRFKRRFKRSSQRYLPRDVITKRTLHPNEIVDCKEENVLLAKENIFKAKE